MGIVFSLCLPMMVSGKWLYEVCLLQLLLGDGGRKGGCRLKLNSVPSNRVALSSADSERTRAFMSEHFSIDPWFPMLVRGWFGISIGTSDEWS